MYSYSLVGRRRPILLKLRHASYFDHRESSSLNKTKRSSFDKYLIWSSGQAFSECIVLISPIARLVDGFFGVAVASYVT